MTRLEKKINLLDAFLILLVVLAGLAVYFNFIKPITFSHLIKREAVPQFAEIEMLLPDDLAWMKDKISVGEQSLDVYGQVDWKILDITDVTLAGRPWVKIKVKIKAIRDDSGIVHYGKYTLVQGGKIYLINDHYFLEGRVLHSHLLEEKPLS